MVISSRKFENFEMFCPLGAMKLGVQEKKLLRLIQPSQDPTYIYFFLIQGLRARVCGDWGRGLGPRTKVLRVSN